MSTVAAPWAYTLQLPHDARAPGVARSTLRCVLRAHRMSGLADIAELLASELITNAYLHAAAPYALRIRALEPGRLRIGVWDGSPDIPPPFAGRPLCPLLPTSLAEGGRGLRIVELCADDWGAYRLGGAGGHTGKLLWVECAQQP